MKQTNNDNDKLRSDKIKKILGKPPGRTLSWGITVIFVIYLILILIVINFRHPYCSGETILQHLLM